MPNEQAQTNAVQVQTPIEQDAARSVIGLLKKYSNTFDGVLPKHLTKERFAWLAVNSVRQTPALAGCTPASFVNAVLLAANLGIEIRRNSAYLIPYGQECQLLIDYRGKIELARRSGKVGQIVVELVREGDVFEFERTSRGTHFRHVPSVYRSKEGRLVSVPEEDRGEIVLGYTMAEIIGGNESQIDIMTLAQIEKIRRRAKSGCAIEFKHYGKTMPPLSLEEIRKLDVATMGFRDPYRLPWVTDYDQQARKTLVHRGANYWPQTAELVLSQEVDDAEATGRMPVSEVMAQVLIDPADNQPMVESGNIEDQQRVAAEIIEKQKQGRQSRKPSGSPKVDLVQKYADTRKLDEWRFDYLLAGEGLDSSDAALSRLDATEILTRIELAMSVPEGPKDSLKRLESLNEKVYWQIVGGTYALDQEAIDKMSDQSAANLLAKVKADMDLGV